MSVLTFPTASGKTEAFTGITYLSGAIRPEALGRQSNFGVLLTPLMGNVPRPLGIHAHDNGVFTEWLTGGKKPFSLEGFLRHLDLFSGMRHYCLFATAPDVIGNWWGTLARSKPVLPLIRARGYRAALVAQNGLEHHLGRIPWDDFDVLFLGGGLVPALVTKANPKGEWKLGPGAARLVGLARAQGKDVHMGRVNSLKRLKYAQSIGCTSADGTKIAFGPDIHTPTVIGWVKTLNGWVQHNVAGCVICRWKCEQQAAAQRIPIGEFIARKNLELAAHPELLAGHTPRLAYYARPVADADLEVAA